MNPPPDGTEKSKNRPHNETRSDSSGLSPPDEHPPDMAAGLTLEQIIDLTDELAHLNELVMIHISNSGGFTVPAAYFRTVQPILDQLEMEIRIRFRPGMNAASMKLVVQDWIDKEIAALKNRRG